MKKTQLLLIFIAFTVISCSKNNDNQSSITTPSNSIKKISETTYIGGTISNYTADFNYENGILKTITDTQNRIELTYSGDKISSSVIYTNNVISATFSFNYNSGLIETILNTKNNSERNLFSYNNGILTSEKNQSLNSSNWQTVHTYNYEFLNGNILTHYSFFQFDTSMSKYTHEYDTKLNPMHYMNPVVRHIIGIESCDFNNLNNETKQYRYSDSTSTTPILDFTYQITYNAQNLPINIKKYNAGNGLVSEASFEYN